MVISNKEEQHVNIFVDNEKIEQVRRFKYLGQQITDDGRNVQEVKQRIAIAKSAFVSMKQIFLSRNVSMHLKLRLIKCYIFSILTYGSETWTINKLMENRICAFEIWIFRRIGSLDKNNARHNGNLTLHNAIA